MTEPMDESGVRRLLARAADTIEVDVHAPLHLTGFPEPMHRRRWPLVVAAAVTVVALVGGGLAAGAMLGRDGDAAPADQQSATDRTSGRAVPSASDVSAAAPVPPTAPRRAAAEQFVRWARGNAPAPPFADSVRNLGPGFVADPNNEPESREYWAGCSGLGFPDCGIDPIASLVHDPSAMVALAGRLTCSWLDAPRADPIDGWRSQLPPQFLTPDAEADAVRLQPVGATDCAAGTLINLWIHPNGEIYGVALVLPVLPPGA